MSVSFELPIEIEQALRREFADLNGAAKESALVEMYRQEKITRRELSDALVLGRIETDALLKRHNVTEDLLADEETLQDIANLRRLLKK
jgi:Uncharacterised protein family (UPF0175)